MDYRETQKIINANFSTLTFWVWINHSVPTFDRWPFITHPNPSPFPITHLSPKQKCSSCLLSSPCSQNNQHNSAIWPEWPLGAVGGGPYRFWLGSFSRDIIPYIAPLYNLAAFRWRLVSYQLEPQLISWSTITRAVTEESNGQHSEGVKQKGSLQSISSNCTQFPEC